MKFSTKILHGLCVKRKAGASLIQLLAVLAIAGIIMAVSVPSYTEIIARRAVESTAKSFSIALDYSRRYARKYSGRVALCAGTPAQNCAAGEWGENWTLFKVEYDAGTAKLVAVKVFPVRKNYIKFFVEEVEFVSKIVIDGRGYIVSNDKLPAEIIVCSNSTNSVSTTTLDHLNQRFDSYEADTVRRNKCL